MCNFTFLRIGIAAFLAALVAGCGGSVELMSNMHEAEANEVVATLNDAGIKAQKLPGKDGAVNVSVEQATVAKAVFLLRDEGLPRERRATMGDVFRKEGLISSPLEERARYLWALSQELSETVSQVDGVVKARVHVVLPERSTGGDAALPSSAAVFVKYRRGYNLDESMPQIKRLVASSIPGLNVDKVTVVLVAAASRGATDAMAAAAAGGANGANGANGKNAKPNGGMGLPLWISALLGLAAVAAAGYAVMQFLKARAAVKQSGGANAGGVIAGAVEPT